MTARLSAVDGVQRDISLAPLTSYKLGGDAAWFVEVINEAHLDAVLGSVPPGLDVLILGKGSNLLVADRGFSGLVIRLAGDFLDIVVAADGSVEAGGAAPLPRLARTSGEAGRCGLEFYAGIPGTVGGAVIMNAGGHGSDTAHHLISAVVVDRATGERSNRTPTDLGLGYRSSNLGPDQIVTSARFATSPCTRPEAEARIREITRWRKQHQPGGTFNAGSVFRNPDGDAAGRLIDETPASRASAAAGSRCPKSTPTSSRQTKMRPLRTFGISCGPSGGVSARPRECGWYPRSGLWERSKHAATKLWDRRQRNEHDGPSDRRATA